MRKWALRALTTLYGVLWIGGIVTYSLSLTLSPRDAWAAAAFLIVAAAISVIGLRRLEALILLGAALVAFASEILGVATGLVFGSYQYTGALGYSLFEVPIAIAAAWIVLLAYVWHMATQLKLGLLLRALVAAAWMTSIDLLIDPLAAGPLSYWRWLEGGVYFDIPTSNFLGWFGISLLLLLFLLRKPLRSPAAKLIGASVIAFFTYVAVANSLWIPSLVGAVLLGVDVWFYQAEWRQIINDARLFFARLYVSRVRHER